MQTVVQKWGNSLGIRIPSIYAKELALKNGSLVEISEDEGRIVISPKKISLPELLSQVTTENIHEPEDTGASLGNEEW
ncbi:MAG: multidrug transporter MatE [Spirochaetes bacterium RIFOXYC1_FULL_54_7]|nr:MAG: multidrug transporter MatE [Spirochaetes bacterium RIFOXYC1_FULL_54_7]